MSNADAETMASISDGRNADQRRSSLLRLLRLLDEVSVPYVSWKNNHQLSEALAGSSDLDIFVPLQCRAAFLRCVEGLRWIRVENPVARYPWVTHIYSTDCGHNPYHIHVYFKLVTGESWLKEYVLPLDNFMIENRERAADGCVWILSKKAQAYLFVLRHLLKAGSLVSRTMYFRERGSYRREWHECAVAIDCLNDYGPIQLNGYLVDSGLKDGGFSMPGLAIAVKFRLSMIPYLRMAWWSLPVRRIGSFVDRAINKLILKRKKVLPEGGLILAISGVDGAGKTSMITDVHHALSGFLSVRRYMLGRPQGRFIEPLRKLIRGRRSSGSVARHAGNPAGAPQPITMVASMSAAMLGLLRLRMARKAMKSALHGQVALVDRWPTDVVGMMDGPRIDVDAGCSPVIRLCARIEKWSYHRMPMADVCFFLEVPVHELIERNRRRIKADKESDAEIIARYETNRQCRPLARKVVRFDNDGDFDTKRLELLSLIWTELVNS